MIGVESSLSFGKHHVFSLLILSSDVSPQKMSMMAMLRSPKPVSNESSSMGIDLVIASKSAPEAASASASAVDESSGDDTSDSGSIAAPRKSTVVPPYFRRFAALPTFVSEDEGDYEPEYFENFAGVSSNTIYYNDVAWAAARMTGGCGGGSAGKFHIEAIVSFAAVLDYFIAEVVELAGNEMERASGMEWMDGFQVNHGAHGQKRMLSEFVV